MRTPGLVSLGSALFRLYGLGIFFHTSFPLILKSWVTWLRNVNHFLPLLFISAAVFAFSFIDGALIAGRSYDGLSFNALR